MIHKNDTISIEQEGENMLEPIISETPMDTEDSGFALLGEKPESTASRFMESLADAMTKDESEELGAENPDEMDISREKAEFYTKRYKKLQAEIDGINEAADAYRKRELQKIEGWRERETGKCSRLMDFCRWILESYARKELKDSKKRSCSLIEGTLQFHKQQNKYDYNDDKLIKFMRDNGGEKFLKPQPPKVDHTAFKKAGTEKDGKFYFDGKYVDGIVITQRPEAFVVK